MRNVAILSHSIGAASAMAAHLAREKAASMPVETTVEILGEVVDETPAPEPKPLEGLPDSHPDWRVNNEALRPIAANSPLETRQQRRAASKALARGLATAGKLKEREARVMERKRQRADEAQARYDRIKNHVPRPAAD